MRAMAEATPGAVFTVIPDAGHLANMNAPAAFNHAVAEFLAIPAEGRG
jgi:3-oxoadipate enol-lactonase